MLASKQNILPALETATNLTSLVQQYPWYPTAQLWLSEQGDESAPAKLAAFVQHPLRMQVLLAASAAQPVEVSPLVPATTNEISDTQQIVEPEEGAIHTHAPTTKIPQEPAETTTLQAEPPHSPTIELGNATENEDLLFQPYHTVDYFAALGIKIDASQLGTTRFDTQLKSFTQWLKTMKRINYTTGEISNDPVVEAQASASLQPKEVVTEAMAEVLAQQGMTKQAIAIYEKLSLLHPEKSVFFAARIEHLKEAK